MGTRTLSVRTRRVSAERGTLRAGAPDGCPRCLLTWTAAELLDCVAARFSLTRADDGSWRVVRCADCRRITAIIDEVDGSVFGDATVDAPRPRVGPHTDGYVRASIATATERNRRPTRRHRSHRWIAVVCAGLAALAMAATSFGAMLFVGRSVELARDVPSITRTVRADVPLAMRQPVVERSIVRPLDGVVVTTPRGVGVRRIDAIGHATWVAAVATIESTGDEAVPPTDVTFRVVDAAGEELGEIAAFVTLDRGESKIVAAPRIEIPILTDHARVEVSVAPSSTSSAVTSFEIVDLIVDEHGRDARIVGRVVNDSRYAQVANVSCVLVDAMGEVRAAAATSVRVGPRGATMFRVHVHAATVGAADASCAAS